MDLQKIKKIAGTYAAEGKVKGWNDLSGESKRHILQIWSIMPDLERDMAIFIRGMSYIFMEFGYKHPHESAIQVATKELNRRNALNMLDPKTKLNSELLGRMPVKRGRPAMPANPSASSNIIKQLKEQHDGQAKT